jgi:hypothetical protein
MYRWVDEKGEVHFSDNVPVVATRKAVSEINKNGDVKNTVDPEAEALAKLEFEANTVERERLEAIEKDKQEVIATQKKRDDYLLSTYENKGELMTSFITKIKLMKGNAAILEAQNIVLDKKLTILLDRKIATKNKANKESLESKIININNTIEQYKEALKQNEDERTVLSKNYKKDVKRYSELTQ